MFLETTERFPIIVIQSEDSKSIPKFTTSAWAMRVHHVTVNATQQKIYTIKQPICVLHRVKVLRQAVKWYVILLKREKRQVKIK